MALIYWAAEFCYLTALERDIESVFLDYGFTVQTLCFSFITMVALDGSNKQKMCTFTLLLHTISSVLFYNIFTSIDTPIIQSTSLVFFSMYFWVARRHSLPTQLPINQDNILLAFYRGKKGSFTMNFFSLLDDPVKSMHIQAGGYSLKLKNGKENFEFKKSDAVFRKMDDYFIVDTGVLATEDFIAEMRNCGIMVATRFGLRINCVLAIKRLLGLIGDEWKPRGILENSPSGYLPRASRIKKYEQIKVNGR